MFQLIDQTADFVVVNKPCGISMHKDQQDAGFVMQLQDQLGVDQLFPVHRLDKMTSGIVLLAKTSVAAAELSLQFQNRQVCKFYLAISDKKPRKKQGLIKGDMVKARRGSWKLLKTQNNPAVTQFFSASVGNRLRLFLLKPHTGKTHQLRVAMKSIGAAIVGDDRYHETAQNVVERGYLHAYYLQFDFAGERYCYCTSPASGDLFMLPEVKQQLEQWAEPESLSWPGI